LPLRPMIVPALRLAGEFAESSAECSRVDDFSLDTTDAAAEGHDEAFASLVDMHSRLMFRVAFSLLKNAQDAEDAVQEAFLKLYRSAGWRRMRDEKAFLARTVWRVALDRLPRGREQSLESAAEARTSELDSPEASVMRGARAMLVRRLIDALPEDLRRVLILGAIEDLNSRETAVMLGVSEGTVRTRMMRAKRELKRRFEAVSGRVR
jgi:RNA polymerase sigma-70 factor (ECF subfamily)